jgi:hypothetical protein
MNSAVCLKASLLGIVYTVMLFHRQISAQLLLKRYEELRHSAVVMGSAC